MTTDISLAPEKTTAQTPHCHIVIGDVDVKAKIVAVGQPSEAVSVFCTPRGRGLRPWDPQSEARARNLLEIIRQGFGENFKTIPLMTHNCAGLKIHRHTPNWTRAPHTTGRPASDSLEIFHCVREMLEDMSENPDAVRYAPENLSRRSFHARVAEKSLRNEISRILTASGEIEFKVTSLLRLMERRAH